MRSSSMSDIPGLGGLCLCLLSVSAGINWFGLVFLDYRLGFGGKIQKGSR